MSLFAIGDMHLSSTCEKPMDVFKGWDNYTDRLQSNWNRLVGEEDTVVIAGDTSWAMTLAEAFGDFSLIESLRGKKLILKGNHDYWWNTIGKMNAFLEQCGFKTIFFIHNNSYLVGDIAVCGTRGWFCENEQTDEKVLAREAGRLRASIAAAKKTGGQAVVFLHYPPIGESFICEEICNVLESEGIKRCFFGHLHGFVPLKNASFDYNGVHYELISADHLGFCPRLIEK